MPEKKEEQIKNPSKKVKILDFSGIMMIICLAFIFSLTILNKIGLFSGWLSTTLMLVFLLIMVFFLIKSIKNNKEIAKSEK